MHLHMFEKMDIKIVQVRLKGMEGIYVSISNYNVITSANMKDTCEISEICLLLVHKYVVTKL